MTTTTFQHLNNFTSDFPTLPKFNRIKFHSQGIRNPLQKSFQSITQVFQFPLRATIARPYISKLLHAGGDLLRPRQTSSGACRRGSDAETLGPEDTRETSRAGSTDEPSRKATALCERRISYSGTDGDNIFLGDDVTKHTVTLPWVSVWRALGFGMISCPLRRWFAMYTSVF